MVNKTGKIPIIALTMGDPSGIGPEVAVKALTQTEAIYKLCKPVIFGDRGIIEREVKKINTQIVVQSVDSIDNVSASKDVIYIVECSKLDIMKVDYALPCPEGSTAMAESIIKAVEYAQSKTINAVVTAPINKKALNSAGYHFPGHTEMIANLTNTDDVVMMLAGSKLRVALVTIHCALADVPKLLSIDAILKTIYITDKSLGNYFSIKSPKLAIAGLNPHSGEEQMFGSEEETIIVPAVNEAKKQGIDAIGPIAPDTLFYYAAQGLYDAVICMYHDQGLIPLKLLHFDDAVNITLGLPIIRTSVDHGTAYNIAGKGVANPSSMINAINTAALMAR